MKFELIGSKNTPYENGIFYVKICFSIEYPNTPPNVTFMTKIFHPNIDKNNGNIFIKCLNKDNWIPDMSFGSTIFDILRDIKILMIKPTTTTTTKNKIFNYQALQLYLENTDEYKQTALDWTKKHANKSMIKIKTKTNNQSMV